MLDRTKIIKTFLVIMAFSIAGGMVFFFIFGERYLLGRLPSRGPLMLLDAPAWASEELVDSLYESVGATEL